MASILRRREEAARWFSRARAELQASGQRPLRAIVDHDEALARVRAGIAGFGPLLEAARSRFQELGMTYWLARAEELAATADAKRLSYPAGLTEREVEILRLLAAGRTNKQIAAELVLSLHTVTRHVANVYAKIGAHNRAEATTFALREGLTAST